ncbi:hypothetical protein MTO96_040849 [Rhipicephalus appendiculatus]
MVRVALEKMRQAPEVPKWLAKTALKRLVLVLAGDVVVEKDVADVVEKTVRNFGKLGNLVEPSSRCFTAAERYDALKNRSLVLLMAMTVIQKVASRTYDILATSSPGRFTPPKPRLQGPGQARGRLFDDDQEATRDDCRCLRLRQTQVRRRKSVLTGKDDTGSGFADYSLKHDTWLRNFTLKATWAPTREF